MNDLPYEVMRVNKSKTIINLRVHVQKYQHIGRSFFKLLIEKNKDKLTSDEYIMMTPGLAKALRNIYCHTMRSNAAFVQTSGSRYKFDVLASNHSDTALLTMLAQLTEQQENLIYILC